MICDGLELYHTWLLTERDPKKEKLAVCLHPWETGMDNSPAFESLVDATHSYLEGSNLSIDSFGRADTQHVAARQRPTDRDYYAYFGLVALFKKHSYKQGEIIGESPFLLQDVLFNTVLAASLGATARLMEALAGRDEVSIGQGTELRRRAQASRAEGEAVAGAIRGKMWHDKDGLYYGYDLRSGRQLSRATVASLVPLLGGIATTEQAERLVVHLRDEAGFATPVPVPSTPANSLAFDRQRYWSGPSWPVTNWLLVEGLRDRQPELAETLRIATLDMIKEGVTLDDVRVRAIRLMERNSVRDEFTTPSGNQYAHGWLWDSAIVAMAWPMVTARPGPLRAEAGSPGFWEYYDPYTGEPLGARGMTWTAALLLELMESTNPV
jgi:hypothetical protein